MRRSAVLGFFFLLSIGIAAGPLGCGGGGTSSAGKVASVSLSPTTLSLNRGDVVQVTARALDSNSNAVLSVTPTFSSSTSVITVSSTGLVCAGQWDSTFIVCSTRDSSNNLLPIGTANLTATAASVTSNVVPVIVHEHIDRVEVAPVNLPAGNCVSQGATAPANTTQYAATAFSNDPAVCGIAGTPCPMSGVGTFNWTVVSPAVATIDTANQPAGQLPNQITVTAHAPGQTNIVASISGVTSAPSPLFITCSPASISIHVSGGTATSFTIAKAATQQLAADSIDTNVPGVPITANVFTWNSSQPAAIPVSGTGLVTGSASGTASIIASCTPPTCNANINQPIYSNVVTANVSGTTTTNVFVSTTTAPASGASNAIVPINTSTNTAGTAITLPKDAALNSLVLNGSASQIVMGSNQGLIFADANALTLGATVSGVTGKVLAASPNGSKVIGSDTALGEVFVYNLAAGALEAILTLPNATAAAFSPDNLKAYIVSNGTLFDYSTVTGQAVRALSSTGHDVSFLASGAAAYVATDAGDDVVATCNDNTLTTVTVGAAKLIAGVPNGTQVVDVNPPNIDQISVTANGACPPTVNNSFNAATDSHGFPGVPSFTARKLIVTPNSQKALIISDQGVLVYNIGATPAAGTTSVVPLSGGAVPLSGGVTLDSASLYVGASDNKVHRIDLTASSGAGADAQQITVPFTPDLLAVKPAQTVTPVITAITVTPANSTLPVGQTLQFTATATFSDGSTTNITSSATWASSNTTVASITSTGLAHGLTTGTTTISASSGGVTGSTNLAVGSQVITAISVTPANPTVHVGQTQQFTATATFSDGSTRDITSSATWASSNATVATITSTGLATALASGTTTISASSGGVTGSTNLSVIP